MASAVATNNVPISYGWLSPRASFSRELESATPAAAGDPSPSPPPLASPLKASKSALPSTVDNSKDFIEFEFCLRDDPVAMLPADELFADGKLLPLHPQLNPPTPATSADVVPPEPVKPRAPPAIAGVSDPDPYVFSPKAPSCSSRWRELLGLKKSQQNNTNTKPSSLSKTTNPNPNPAPTPSRSLKYFLHRNTRSDSILSLPLLHRDSDADSVSISARLSLSSSSSSERSEDLPRLSLDSDKMPPRLRLVRARLDSARAGRSPVRLSTAAAPPPPRGLSVDSPRMNSSGKIIFQGLERSSSSPGSFNGGPRPVRPRAGMERSYSTNVVRVTPVLNVPVCSLRGSAKSSSVFGFGQLFSPQKKERDGAGSGSCAGPVRSGSSLARTGSRTKTERALHYGSRD